LLEDRSSPAKLPSHAQQFPGTERQKAEEDRDEARDARKKTNEEAIDEGMERTPRPI